MTHLIEILSKNSNTVSYYFTNRDDKGFIDIFYITEPEKSNIKIQIYNAIEINGVGRQYNKVPNDIRLDNEKIRYLDLAIIFDTKRIDAENPPTVDEYIIKLIVDECAFNEDYCEYVLSIAEELSTIEGSQYVAFNIVNTIIPAVIETLENHSKFVTQAFEKYKANGYKLDCEDQNKEEPDYFNFKDLIKLCAVLGIGLSISNNGENIEDGVYAKLSASANEDFCLMQSCKDIEDLHSNLYLISIYKRDLYLDKNATDVIDRFLKFWNRVYGQDRHILYPTADDINFIIKSLKIKVDFIQDEDNPNYVYLLDNNTNSVSRTFSNEQEFYEFLYNKIISKSSAENVEVASAFNEFTKFYMDKFVNVD